jgi:hypothetical protein
MKCTARQMLLGYKIKKNGMGGHVARMGDRRVL